MEQVVARGTAERRFAMVLVAIFAVSALLLAAVGIYGVMSYSVSQRTREIGVRMALGATPASVLQLVLRQAGVMTAAGISIGLVGALTLTRFLAAFLFGVTAKDPLVYGAVALLLALVALVAVIVPSARATRVDPLVALR
jgi:putative ABC transport system permease protein